MDAISLHDAFVPQGSAAAPVRAVSLGAGCIWLEAYQVVTTQGGRYVQGGGCTTVGVAGLVQGGGFGSFSKGFGLSAASLLEAEIVTADGKLRVVNAAQDADLFWALKGGGGGTFGVVTSLTLQTHDLPDTFGLTHWAVTATSDQAFRALLDRFVAVYAERLFNPHWGEQATAGHGNVFQVTMLFQGLDEAKARDDWRPMADFVAAHAGDYRIDSPLLIAAFPARDFWNEAFVRQHMPQVLQVDDRAGAQPGDWWWAGNTNEAGTFWHGYHSLWMPASLLAPDRRAFLVEAWFQASRHWSVTFHFNKGLAGAAPEAVEASRQTAMNPEVLDAFALAIIADDGPCVFPPLPQPDLSAARDDAARMASSVVALRQAAPKSGSYLSESDYGLADWKTACWGQHALRLDQIKRRYDPGDLFIVHHGIGSDRWSDDGFNPMSLTHVPG